MQRSALELITARYESGAASGLEVTQQQALLDNTLTQVNILAKQRSQFEDAIASLTGIQRQCDSANAFGHDVASRDSPTAAQ